MRETKKIVFFKRMKITNIFESYYKVPEYKDLEYDAYVLIKRMDTMTNRRISVSSQSINSSLSNYRSLEDKMDEDSPLYTFYCGPVKMYKKEHNFYLSDWQVMRKFSSNPESFVDVFLSNYLIQLKFPSKVNSQRSGKISSFSDKDKRFYFEKRTYDHE